MSANGLRAGFRGSFRNVINVQMSAEILKCKIPAMKLARCYALPSLVLVTSRRRQFEMKN
jgi:hypothetical protein